MLPIQQSLIVNHSIKVEKLIGEFLLEVSCRNCIAMVVVRIFKERWLPSIGLHLLQVARMLLRYAYQMDFLPLFGNTMAM